SAWHAATAKRAAHTRVRFIISRMLEPSLVRSRSVYPICDEQKDAPKLVGGNLVPHSAEVASDLGAAFGMHFPHVPVAEQGQGPQHAIARARAMERHRPLIEHMHVLDTRARQRLRSVRSREGGDEIGATEPPARSLDDVLAVAAGQA